MSDLMKHQRQLLGIAKTWALKSIPGWSEECHRDLIQRHGASCGRQGNIPSSLTMSGAQIGAALNDYEKRGWPRKKGYVSHGGEVKKVSPGIAHIVCLWGRLGQAGKVANATRPALLAFSARQTGREIRNLDSLDPAESTALIEALKSWLAR